MNIAIRYFTKSGNTQKLADAISQELNVTAYSIDQSLDNKVDILLLGCSYYAFDMDASVKEFLKANQDNICKIALFGTSAMMKSMKKPMSKVLSDLDMTLLEEEFHCHGSFGPMHKGKPDENDLKNVKEFARKIVNK